jgi:hypothetical protein
MKTRSHIPTSLFCLAIWFFVSACSTPPQPTRHTLEGRPAEAVAFFEALDAAVEEHGVRNAAAFAVPGFPYLRTNRFLGDPVLRQTGPGARDLWIDSMRRLDRYGRRQEIQNLPDPVVTSMANITDPGKARTELARRADLAAAQLIEYDRNQAGFEEKLWAAAVAPSEYSTSMRVLGLYPLFVIPFGIGTEHAYFRFRQWHAAAPEDLPLEGTLTTFVPEADGPERIAILEILAGLPRDAFGFPVLSPAYEKQLIEAFAPVIVQDVAGDYDRFGQVRWRADRVGVDIDRPTVYFYLTKAYMGKDPVLQLNYTFWYTARAGRRPPSFEKGPMDGVTVRINLDLHGRADLVDIINNCGCYYLIVPRRERIQTVTSTFSGLYPFVPTYLPEGFPERSLTLRLISGWHQIERVSAESPSQEPAVTYRLLPYERLESLPRDDGSQASVFTDQGIMKDSERIEPYIFFSMGIPKIGYMRQRSHHAIELVGRAHFTDPGLYNRYFEFRP